MNISEAYFDESKLYFSDPDENGLKPLQNSPTRFNEINGQSLKTNLIDIEFDMIDFKPSNDPVQINQFLNDSTTTLNHKNDLLASNTSI